MASVATATTAPAAATAAVAAASDRHRYPCHRCRRPRRSPMRVLSVDCRREAATAKAAPARRHAAQSLGIAGLDTKPARHAELGSPARTAAAAATDCRGLMFSSLQRTTTRGAGLHWSCAAAEHHGRGVEQEAAERAAQNLLVFARVEDELVPQIVGDLRRHRDELRPHLR